jgi:hypothetical protein
MCSTNNYFSESAMSKQISTVSNFFMNIIVKRKMLTSASEKKKGKKANLPVEYMKIIGKKVPTRTRYVNPIYRSFIKKKKNDNFHMSFSTIDYEYERGHHGKK